MEALAKPEVEESADSFLSHFSKTHRPIALWLGDEAYSLKVKVFRVNDDEDQQEVGEKEIHQWLKLWEGKRIKVVRDILERSEVNIDGETFRFDFLSGVAEEILGILCAAYEKTGSWETRWYILDEDRMTDDFHLLFRFFVTGKDGSFVSTARFSVTGLDDADMSLFRKRSHGGWESQKSTEQAHAALAYRKFYSETQEGQLVALTPGALLYYQPPFPNEDDVSPAERHSLVSSPVAAADSHLKEIDILNGLRAQLRVVIFLLVALTVKVCFF